jgi:threonine/homoserine/homoserine lactone efflux protein
MLDWLSLSTYAMIMSITPGPNNVMLMASGARFGFRRTVPHLIGIAAGVVIQTVLACSGLAIAFQQMPGARRWLTYVGVGYMVWLAVKLLRSGKAANRQVAKPLSTLQALMFQAVNPKAWVMTLTTALVFTPKTGNLAVGIAVLALFFIVIAAPCFSLWAACGSALRSWLDVGRRRSLFNGLMAASLAATAASMLWSA